VNIGNYHPEKLISTEVIVQAVIILQ